MDDERRQLVDTNRALQAEVDELRQMVGAQGERIAELEEVLEGEVATSAVVNQELQDTRARLTRLGRDVRTRAFEILADATSLVEDAAEVIPDEEEEDPEEDPEEEVPPDSPAMD
ncbi:uncharacterized protein [Coffea arabica]|uniref:Cell division protein ZapB n=1 Tax=Coffea arabica TaxID=13443 RepID=A0ABM4VA63_COFAR